MSSSIRRIFLCHHFSPGGQFSLVLRYYLQLMSTFCIGARHNIWFMPPLSSCLAMNVKPPSNLYPQNSPTPLVQSQNPISSFYCVSRLALTTQFMLRHGVEKKLHPLSSAYEKAHPVAATCVIFFQFLELPMFVPGKPRGWSYCMSENILPAGIFFLQTPRKIRPLHKNGICVGILISYLTLTEIFRVFEHTRHIWIYE